MLSYLELISAESLNKKLLVLFCLFCPSEPHLFKSNLIRPLKDASIMYGYSTDTTKGVGGRLLIVSGCRLAVSSLRTGRPPNGSILKT